MRPPDDDLVAAVQQLERVPNVGLSPNSLAMLLGWSVDHATDVLRALVENGTARGHIGRRATLVDPPDRPAGQDRPQTQFRYVKGWGAIAGAGWDPERRVLELVFRNNRSRLYRYCDVDPADGQAMVDALNTAYRMDVFKAKIEGRYSFTRVAA